MDDGRGVDTLVDYAQSFIDYVIEDANAKPTDYSTKRYAAAP